MSSFTCGDCGAHILDTPLGYATACEHYPASTLAPGTHVRGNHVVRIMLDGRVNVINAGEPLKAATHYPKTEK